MNRPNVVLVAAVLVAALVAPASAVSPHPQAIGSHKVVHPNGAFQHVRLSAHSEPGNVNPHGRVHVTSDLLFGGIDVSGTVVCLQVSGAEARVAAALDERGPAGATHVTLTIRDGGNPGRGQSPDRVSIYFDWTGSPPIECALSGVSLFGEATGNLVVRGT